MKRHHRIIPLAVALACVILSARDRGFARTPDEIRKSGVLVVAVSEQPTVYQKGGKEPEGFHYRLAVLYAKSLGVRLRTVTVNPRDYFRTDRYQFPLLFRDADIFVGRFRDPGPLKASVQTIPIYTALRVCLYRRRNPVSGLSDLPRLKLSALSWDADPLVPLIEKKTGRALPRQLSATVDEQVRAILAGTADYALQDSDLALTVSRQNEALAVNIDVLKNVAVLQDVSWWTARQNSGLRQSAADFLNGLRASGEFEKIWNDNYPLTFGEYREILGILEQKGDELFRKALDLAFSQKYAESLELFRSVRKMKLSSDRFQRLYDTIYSDWIAEEKKSGSKRQIEILDAYMRGEPSDFFIANLRKTQPSLYRGYLERLKQDRRKKLDQKDYAGAISVQTVIAAMSPGPKAEKLMTDSIFISLLEDEEQKNPTGALTLLQQYLEEKPTPYFYEQLRGKLPALYDDYRGELKGELENALRRGDVSEAVRIQERAVTLSPQSFEESNRLLLLKKSAAAKPASSRPAAEEDIPPVPVLIPPAVTNVPSASANMPPAAGEDTAVEQQVLTQGTAAVENYEGQRYYEMGVRYWESKSYPEALEAFQNARSLNFNRDSSEDYITRIRAVLDEQNRKVIREKQEKFDRLFEQALTDYLQENYSRALENILACLDLFPDNTQARTYSGIIADNLRISGEKDIDPSSPYFSYFQNRLLAGNRLIADGRYADARAVFEELLTVFPNNETARQKLAVCLYKQDPEALKKILKEYVQTGQQLLRLKKTREAHLKFSFVRDMDPKYPGLEELWEKTKTGQARPAAPTDKKSAAAAEDTLRQAIALYEKGDLRGSLALYRRILAANPADYKAAVNASRIENQLNLQKETGTTEETSVLRDKARNVYLQGQFYFRVRDYRQALAFWEEAYRIDPTYRKAYIDMMRIKKMLGDME